ncbi:urease accessory protein UreF [Mesobaculum littorinae]|uniref:Urease accessory protein UreF n=1 Tax=Mesobaculum littorinae TaxID=2486419 RepID=A0A438AJJ6_9RHOB|nr:urease accessory UreF family protein [Mesobaculum littorinae]RVV98848.1 urease accessory protein UreF [Mesobaculum littorinae]
MADTDHLTLAQWVSPAFPISSYAYSHGLEQAIATGDVTGPDALRAWIAAVVQDGSGLADAVLVHATLRGEDVADWAAALATSRERWEETRDQGRAFARMVDDLDRLEGAREDSWDRRREGALNGGQDGEPGGRRDRGAAGVPTDGVAYPVAFGRAARRLDLPADVIVARYLQAFAANLVSAAVRLMPLGQSAGQGVLAALAPVIAATATRARGLGCDDIVLATPAADLAAMCHETMAVRHFRT